jgi:hypothetical protein
LTKKAKEKEKRMGGREAGLAEETSFAAAMETYIFE